jgi:fructokinase
MIGCCGAALVDLVPDGTKENAWLARPGGCPYNTAIAAARLGAETAFIGRVGTDFMGDMLFERLEANGVDTRFVARRSEPATLAFVKRSAAGDARYAFYSCGAADRSLALGDLPSDLGPEARFLVFGSISLAQEPAAATIDALVARESLRRLVSFDPNIRPALIPDKVGYLENFSRWVSRSAIVKISSDDLEWLFPGKTEAECMDRMLSLGASLIALTKGGEGALVRTKSAFAQAGAIKVKVADTIGAGDTFHAALLARLERDGIATRSAIEALGSPELRSILNFANAAAACNCTRTGAEPPTLSELESFSAATPGAFE